MSENTELLGCPFCGEQPESAPYEMRCVNAYCEAQPTVSGGTEAEVRAAWSRRATSSTPSDSEMLDYITKHRVELTPEFEGPWDAKVYGEDDKPTAIYTGNTPRDAIRAAMKGGDHADN